MLLYLDVWSILDYMWYILRVIYNVFLGKVYNFISILDWLAHARQKLKHILDWVIRYNRSIFDWLTRSNIYMHKYIIQISNLKVAILFNMYKQIILF